MGGQYDHAARRRTKRAGRERGCCLYVPAEVLRELGFGPDEAPPFYRLWSGAPRPRIVVNLYREQ